MMIHKDAYEQAIARMLEVHTLMQHYASKGANTLYKRAALEMTTLVRDWGEVALRAAIGRYRDGVGIQTPV